MQPSSARVVGFLDSPYWMDFRPAPSSGFAGFLYQERLKYYLMNTTGTHIRSCLHSRATVVTVCTDVVSVGVLSDECMTVYALAPWKCQLGQYRMPFVKTSFFVVLDLSPFDYEGTCMTDVDQIRSLDILCSDDADLSLLNVLCSAAWQF